jgi:hypothetical protein
MAGAGEIGAIIIVVDQVAISVVAGEKVIHLATPPRPGSRALAFEDADGGIGNRGDLPPSLIAPA